MNLEKSIVGMVVTWSAVTLEAILNHTISEQFDNRLAATSAIEDPKSFLKDFKLDVPQGTRSELALKVLIISDSIKPDSELWKTANTIAARRNKIIHDKPHYFYQSEEYIDEWSYSKRGNEEPSSPSYEFLKEHFKLCDSILDYIERFHTIDEKPSRRFSSLLEQE